jgi:hypothetical protein
VRDRLRAVSLAAHLTVDVPFWQARLRHADRIEQCPSWRAKRKTYARIEFFSV